MFDAQQVEQRVADWASGRLPSGDALFFRRYHIRPLWHSGVDVLDFGINYTWRDRGGDYISQTAGFEIVDAAGVSYPLCLRCGIEVDFGQWKQRRVAFAEVRSDMHSSDILFYIHHDEPHPTYIDLQPEPALNSYTQVYLESGCAFSDNAEQQHSNPFENYLCHGHLHGLSEQQWEEATAGRNIYHREHGFGGDEGKDDAEAAVSKADLFPTRLKDVVDKQRYRHLQRSEIRRMVAVATRLAMLDADVDAAIFPCFQPAAMRQKFEAVVQSRRETEIAGLPAALPAVLHGMVAGYEGATLVDIPL